MMTLKQVVEALVFASRKPLTPKEIVAALRSAGQEKEDPSVKDHARTREEAVVAALEELQKEYTESGRAFRLTEHVNGWQLVSDPECAAWVRQLYPESRPARLSGPGLETLAIVAYRQPITRADIEAVRGVAVDGVLQSLLDRGLVRIAGRAEVPGRPLLYETTQAFMEHFGFKSLDELPNSEELRRLDLPKAPMASIGAEPAAGAELPGLAPEASAGEGEAVADPSETETA